MIDSRLTVEPAHQILVCEPQPRWIHLVQRFAAQMSPRAGGVIVTPCDCESLMRSLTVQQARIIFWGLMPENYLSCVQWIARISFAVPPLLQVAATTGISDSDRMALLQLGAATTIGQPHEVASLAPMLRRYFAQLPNRPSLHPPNPI